MTCDARSGSCGLAERADRERTRVLAPLVRFGQLIAAVTTTALGVVAASAQPCPPAAPGISAVHIAGSPRDARLAQLAVAQVVDIANADPTATIAIAAAELRAHLGKVSSAPIAVRAGAPAPCRNAIELRLLASARLGEQSFTLQTISQNLVITARTPIGLLYGAYEALHVMGFRWYGTSELWSSAPPSPTRLPDLAVARTGEPRFKWRGAVTFDAIVPDSHLLWMARNKQNLIGRSGVNVSLAHALGIRLDGGGHQVISTIIHSSRVVDGRKLVDLHPEWYGLAGAAPGAADVLAFNSESYANPCLANPSLIRFFARELAARVIDGDLRGVSILHLWPSDRPSLSLPPNCLAQLPGARPAEHLIRFYAGVMSVLQAEIERRKPERNITIAGISYYDTWELPPMDTIRELAPRPNVGFMQVLYVNERTYSTPISASAFGTNRKIDEAIASWSKALAPLGIDVGVCEYYGYSVFFSIPASFERVLATDFDSYERRSVSFMTYMHPIQLDAGPQRLVEAIRSRLLWRGTEPVDKIVSEYFRRMFGAADVMTAFQDVDRALSNMAEILGPSSSLINLLGQHRIWARPAFAEAKVPAAARIYLRGGRHVLPLIRDTYFSPLASEFLGLSASVDVLRSAERRLHATLAVATGDAKTRLERDMPWVAHARAVYTAVATIAEFVASTEQTADSRKEAKKRVAEALDEVDRLGRFGWTLSQYDQRAIFRDKMTFARSRLEASP